MLSVETRLILLVIVVALFIAYRMKLPERLQERKAKKEKEKAQRTLKERKQERIEQLRKERESKERLTAEMLRRSAQGLEQKSVELAGDKVWYLEGPRQEGASVVLLHGFASDKEVWSEMAKPLVAAGFHVVAPDLPGCGQNRKDPDASYDVPNQVRKVRGFLRKLKIERFHVVGCSVGGAIAAACAYAGPEEVLSLTLIEPLGMRVPYESELDRWLSQDRNPLVIANPAAYDNMLGFLYEKPPEMPAAIKEHRAEQAAKHRLFHLKVWKEALQGEHAHLLDRLLPEIGARTLVVLGEKSKVVHPATADVIQHVMRNVRSVVVEGCGHFVMAERPRETARHLSSFLGAAESSGTADSGVRAAASG